MNNNSDQLDLGTDDPDLFAKPDEILGWVFHAFCVVIVLCAMAIAMAGTYWICMRLVTMEVGHADGSVQISDSGD